MPPRMESLCNRSFETLNYFHQNGLLDIQRLHDAKGILIMKIGQLGLIHCSVRTGSGILFSRLANRSWSAPCAIECYGMGVGCMAGIEASEVVMLLNNDAAIQSFTSTNNLTIGGELSAALGSNGRSTGVSTSLSRPSEAVVSLARSKGIYLGASIDGVIIHPAKSVNKLFYGIVLHSQDILSGVMPAPAVAGGVYELLRQYEQLAITRQQLLANMTPVVTVPYLVYSINSKSGGDDEDAVPPSYPEAAAQRTLSYTAVPPEKV
ncbi:uncharacterized protein BJ171DRAFT_594980 [Polychytrium aggregatum]|uniref:uncharacterized protein n=1 Tax=Polychytrium aggregatum TaxID=110093 RepID=UPI0022FE7B3D|nr:uncharacterized protein BJ171DRAFT_594980 [Polychytrium aggregatum]KAI9209206.1 hypothetical protein BJ171DRAFT_594980 [Polychytrium aggregatum]